MHWFHVLICQCLGLILLFTGMLAMAMLIGIYHAIKDRKKETLDTYYFGGKKMSPVNECALLSSDIF